MKICQVCLGLCNNQEGWDGEGTHVYPWLIHVDVWQKPTQFCKSIILQLKINKISLKKENLPSLSKDTKTEI